MKRRIRSILTALCLALTLLPVSALAAEPIAEVNGANCNGLEEVIAAVQNASGAEIKLLANVTLSNVSPLTIPDDKTVTLDLNGFTITENGAGTRCISNAGVLTISDGKGTGCIKNTDNGSYGLISNTGTLTITGGTFTDVGCGSGSSVRNSGSGVVLITGGTFIGTGDDSEDGTENNYAKAANARIYSDGASVTITGGSFSSEKACYTPVIKIENGTANISNAMVSAYKGGGVEAAGGEVILENTTIGPIDEQNSYYATAIAASRGGKVTVKSGEFSAKDYAVYIYNSGGSVDIQDGTFTATTVLRADVGNSMVSSSTIVVSGGNFVGGYHIPESEKASLTVTGGSFSEDVNQYVPNSGNGMTVSNDGEKFIVSVSDDAVAKVNGVGYKTLQAAIDAAKDGDTVTLLDNTTVTSTGSAANNNPAVQITKAITLDGNGHAINVEGAFTTNNSVVSVDGVEGGVLIKDLTVNAGSYEHVRNCLNVWNSANVTLENVKTTGGTSGVVVNGSDVTIQGDKTNIGNGSWTYAVNVDKNGASLTIEEGTVGTVYVQNTEGNENTTATIKGGSIENVGKVGNGTEIVVTGGTFGQSVAEYVDDSYDYELNDGGTYSYYATEDEALKAATSDFAIVKNINGGSEDGTSVTYHKVTINYNNSQAQDVQYVEEGKPFTLPAPASKPGYTFDGWMYGGTYYHPAGTVITVTNSVIIDAHWTPSSSSSSSSSSGEPSYSPSLDVSDGGSVKVSPRTPEEGETMTITPEPERGYDVGSVTVTDRNGREVKVTEQRNSTYTFKQPRGRVTIEVTFVRTDAPQAETPFLDVAEDAWYADAVAYVYENGLMSGTGANTFSPNATTTRGMIVTMLYRLEGEPDVSFGSSFDDVDAGMYYADPIAWASTNGIVTGYDESAFGPNDATTREQMAAILYRYAQYKGYDTDQGGMAIREYKDYESISEYALSAMGWAVSEGLVTGTGNAALTPGGNAIRAQVATIFQRFMEGVAE